MDFRVFSLHRRQGGGRLITFLIFFSKIRFGRPPEPPSDLACAAVRTELRSGFVRLPNADRAEVDLRKLSEYCLSPVHPVGKHKAARFRAVLGLTAADAPMLKARLLQAAIDGEAVKDRSDEFGDRYWIDFEFATPGGCAWVRSAWIIRSGEDFPRLTTCYLRSKGGNHGDPD
jgi:hypothetical protein